MKSICIMREILKGIGQFERSFDSTYHISLNEAIVLCTLQESPKPMTSTHLSKQTELSPSHTSKIIRILEEKELIKRLLSEEDKRLMFFRLTDEGKRRVQELNLEKVEIPKLLQSLME